MHTPAKATTPALLALALGYFTFGTSSLAVVGLSSPLSHDLHVKPARVGLLVSVFALTFAIAALVAPTVLRGLNRRHVLLLGLALMAAGGLLSALAPSYSVLMAARVVGALGGAAYAPTASAAGSTLVQPEHRSRALATVFAGMTAASVLGVPLASFFGTHIGWRWTLGMVAALTALALLLVLAVLPMIERDAPQSLQAYREVLSTSSAVATVITTLLYMAGQFTVYGVAGAYVAARSNASSSAVVLVLFAFGVLGVAGNAMGAPVYERLGGDRTISIALTGIALAFVGLAIMPRATGTTLALFAFWAFFSQMYQAPQQARLVALMPSHRGILLSLNASTMYIGVSLGGFLGGMLLPTVGTRWLPLIGLISLALAGLAHLRTIRRPAATHVPPVTATASISEGAHT